MTPYHPTRNYLRPIVVTFPDGTEQEFDCIRAAADATGLPYFRIRQALKHETEWKGYKFRDLP